MLGPDKEDTRKDEYDFTGERFMPQQTDPLLALEHYHRYHFAARFAKNRRVLDIACGEGYGSAFLAKYASEIIGIDSDQATIDHAAQKYSSLHNLSFKVGRCEVQNEDLGNFDLVVSYETIEHLAQSDQVELLKKARKILKQNGLFIVSSPEKNEYAAAVQGKNQFHEHEMTHFELKSCLQSHFKYVYLCGQRILSLSAMWQLEGWQNLPFRFDAKRDLLEDVPGGESFSPPLYLIALCSNEPLSDNIIAEANSFYFDTANVEKIKNFYEWAMQMDADAQKSREVFQNLEHQLAERADWAQNLQQEIKAYTEMIESQKKEIEDRTQWAQSLEAEVEKERACSGQLDEKLKITTEKLDEITEKLRGTTEKLRETTEKLDETTENLTETTEKLGETAQRLMAIASSPIYRMLEKIRLLPDALGRR